MNRKLVVLLTTWLVLECFGFSQNTEAANDTAQGCRRFVQVFYDWYVPIALKEQNETASNIALRLKPSDFKPTLQKLLKRDSEAQARSSEVVGIDYDPFLASQDPSERFVVRRVSVKGTECAATVVGLSSGVQREKLVAVLRFGQGKWRFSNFYYSNGNERWNLIQNLRDLQVAQESEAKKKR